MKTTIKILGRRSWPPSGTPELANDWLKTIRRLHELSGNRGLCPTGLYRFKSFEEADEWLMNMAAKHSHATQP